LRFTAAVKETEEARTQRRTRRHCARVAQAARFQSPLCFTAAVKALKEMEEARARAARRTRRQCARAAQAARFQSPLRFTAAVKALKETRRPTHSAASTAMCTSPRPRQLK
jgi:hypothetical protein